MLKDFVDFALVMGRAAGKAAEDLTGLMVVRVGAESARTSILW